MGESFGVSRWQYGHLQDPSSLFLGKASLAATLASLPVFPF
jgi:hypothetical protein